jgi:DNA polymerase I-like protein with 3'-5' exonuclease and polymerase domains
MKVPRPVVIDFETQGIDSRPHYPPIPVGVSIKYYGKKAKYWAWGHPTGNNCCWSEAKAELKKAYAHKDGIACQNGKFDVDVAEVHLGLPIPKWQDIHDTLFLLFLDDPNQIQLGLKESAARLLDMPPDEQDAVADWLIANQPVPGVKISRSKSSDHYFGRYISLAPGDIVGKYADGDAIRTEKIFELLYQKTVERGMLDAYNRERQLCWCLLDMERQGIRVDHKRLASDVAKYGDLRIRIDEWIIKTLKSPGINLNSGDELIQAMIKAKKVDLDKMPLTATGKYQTNKAALLLGVKDKVLLGMLKYRAQLKTCLDTFLIPWLATADASGGYIFTTWNQTKSAEGADAIGARTGRLSSSPNFQNLPKEFEAIWDHEAPGKGLPKCPIADMLPLPKCRGYVIPYKDDHVVIDRDYSQQEPRILAHFDGGALMEKYIEDPWVDFHDYAKAELELMGKFYDRKPVKNTNLGLIYGMGVGKLAERNNMSVEESAELKKAILLLYPGLKEMYKDMKMRAANNIPLTTWGGREYYCEPPKLVDGRTRTFDYKMVNALIQGSAADCTKQAIIDYYAIKSPETKLYFNVHDQLTASTPKKTMHKDMETMRAAMEGIQFDVPMLSEGAYAFDNWGNLVDYDKKGKAVHGLK